MSDSSARTNKLSALKLALAAQQLRDRVSDIDLLSAEPIAIVGMACRFPGGADDPTSYWKLLCDGVDAITEVPADRWDVNEFYDADRATPGKMNTRWGGFLKRIDLFDAGFFGKSCVPNMSITRRTSAIIKLVCAYTKTVNSATAIV